MEPIDPLRGRYLEAEGTVLGAYGPDGQRIGWPSFQFDVEGRPIRLAEAAIRWVSREATRGAGDIAEVADHPELDHLRAFWALPSGALNGRPPFAVIERDPDAVARALAALAPQAR